MKHLFIGGVRSGKSRAAQAFVEASGKSVCYLATAEALDEGMSRRIRQHQQNRPGHWSLVEEPVHLAQAIQANSNPDQVVLVECLTLWLSNLLCKEDESLLQTERDAFLSTLSQAECDIVLVTNEVGAGIMPMNALARRFGDEAGSLNQAVADLCDQVTLICAGLPLTLK